MKTSILPLRTIPTAKIKGIGRRGGNDGSVDTSCIARKSSAASDSPPTTTLPQRGHRQAAIMIKRSGVANVNPSASPINRLTTGTLSPDIPMAMMKNKMYTTPSENIMSKPVTSSLFTSVALVLSLGKKAGLRAFLTEAEIRARILPKKRTAYGRM